jgi:hypothetical protein
MAASHLNLKLLSCSKKYTYEIYIRVYRRRFDLS